MSGFNLQEMMQQAKQQAEILQKKMEQTVVEASAGGGSVTVKMDGRKQVLGIIIDPTRNNLRGAATISAENSRVTVRVIPPAEDLMIVNHVIRLLGQ